ncbi:hypothetical protein [Cellulomonas hominis]
MQHDALDEVAERQVEVLGQSLEDLDDPGLLVTTAPSSTPSTAAASGTRAGTQVTVGYDLTSLEPTADADLDDFATRYGAHVASWRDAIEVYLAARRA